MSGIACAARLRGICLRKDSKEKIGASNFF
ncbi:hypothetical protein DO65_6184 [Burkholderia pseudomallei]|nr:hypothetical protein DM75_4105 [Burkholderia mallei]KGC54950.1 hypothetical protein DO65_6184 [Burkholderia pseudomallei]KOS95087.1 hypothetical protein DM45_3878 [Burkholderia mallei]KOT12109.1 hypothetical protein DM77_3546 [Burkholderia mallei]